MNSRRETGGELRKWPVGARPEWIHRDETIERPRRRDARARTLGRVPEILRRRVARHRLDPSHDTLGRRSNGRRRTERGGAIDERWPQTKRHAREPIVEI